jgi:hypothetical protein
MTNEEITRFMLRQKADSLEVQISFKKRNSLKGIFIRQPDYEELSRKNLWRIVSEGHIAAYKQSKDQGLAKIFNGSEFTKLEVL